MEFRSAVLLLPLATALHLLEEWPGFPRWARRFASPAYTDREWVVTHLLTLAGSIVVAVLLRVFAVPWLVLAVFVLWVGPGVLCNGLFHAGASLVTRSWCPGWMTGVFAYLPLSLTLVGLALREQLVSLPWILVAAVLAPALHALEVGHDVFKRW